MYFVKKRMEIAGAHRLNLPYESKCSQLHGHNWIITVYCKGRKLTEYGMVMDFTHIKKHIHDKLDHQCINEVIPEINPTAENMAKWILEEINLNTDANAFCYKVEVQESEGNVAAYMWEEDE